MSQLIDTFAPDPLAPGTERFALSGASFAGPRHDAPSGIGTRPWGLRRARPAGIGRSLPAWRYDERQQKKAHDARVIVVGDRVFAAAIHAESEAAYIDWRNDYSALRYERLEPPRAALAGVLEYCIVFGLMYGAFDFVIRPDGRWVFLECNSGGQFGWIEDAIGAPITETIADLLQEGHTGARC